ncbi:MAG: (2Fe-2S)-binding protein [Microthrixaceae bacterium]|nr:(2Fe-2S)-binding protein [Microthrixaceae bacterium]
MIVCSCRAVNDNTVGAAILGGAGNVDDVAAMCGAGGDCGTCRVTIRDMIDEHHMRCGGRGSATAAA